MSAPQGWHPDPTGRHQVRWWDGTRWTDWVGDHGQTSQDPLEPGTSASTAADVAAAQGTTTDAAADTNAVHQTGAAGPDAAQIEHLLSQQRLFVEYGGGTFASAGWRTITDAGQQPVGRIWREGRTAQVCDLDGKPYMAVEARMRRSRTGDRDWRVMALTVSVGGQEWASVDWVEAKAVTLRFQCQGAQVLECRIERSFTGVVQGGQLVAGDGRFVGALTEWNRETSGMVLRSWLVLDKDPALPEPLRSIAVAAPLVFDVFTNPVGRDSES
jgi:hypothetical protein